MMAAATLFIVILAVFLVHTVVPAAGRQSHGFMAYYVVYAPDDTVTAISIFNKYAEAEEANRRMIAWIEHDLGPLLTGPASAVAGPVIVHTLA